MAAKKKDVAVSSPAPVNDDQKCVEEAYREAVKRQVDTYIINCIDGVSEPDERFRRGLAIIRAARQKALALVAKPE